MAEITSQDRPVPTEREQEIIDFFAERWKAWSNSNYAVPDHPEFGQGYDMAKEGCADDVDEFMEKRFGFAWLKAKVKVF